MGWRKAKVIYLILSGVLVKQGVFTQTEIDTICRRGSRKHGYWVRHLRDLLRLLDGRLTEVGHA